MVDHKHRCIFIHIPKCGGQSVENIFLEKNNLTWKTRAPLLLRPNEIPEIGPPRLAHLKYLEYVEFSYVSEEIMSSYLVFSVIRDPYDRIRSLYNYLGYNTAISFSTFVLHVLPDSMTGKDAWFYAPQSEYICGKDGVISVDVVVRLEEIDHQLPMVLAKCGIRVGQVPHVNRSTTIDSGLRWRVKHLCKGVFERRLKINSKVQWGEKEREMVNSLYQRDFSLLGYPMLEGKWN